MTREERVAHFEDILDRLSYAADRLESALKEFDGSEDDLKALESYYTGPDWKSDYEADEAGELPASLKRGVLSQDAVYDLLDRYKELKKEIGR